MMAFACWMLDRWWAMIKVVLPTHAFVKARRTTCRKKMYLKTQMGEITNDWVYPVLSRGAQNTWTCRFAPECIGQRTGYWRTWGVVDTIWDTILEWHQFNVTPHFTIQLCSFNFLISITSFCRKSDPFFNPRTKIRFKKAQVAHRWIYLYLLTFTI